PVRHWRCGCVHVLWTSLSASNICWHKALHYDHSQKLPALTTSARRRFCCMVRPLPERPRRHTYPRRHRIGSLWNCRRYLLGSRMFVGLWNKRWITATCMGVPRSCFSMRSTVSIRLDRMLCCQESKMVGSSWWQPQPRIHPFLLSPHYCHAPSCLRLNRSLTITSVYLSTGPSLRSVASIARPTSTMRHETTRFEWPTAMPAVP